MSLCYVESISREPGGNAALFFSTAYSLTGLAWFILGNDNHLFYLQGKEKIILGSFTIVV